MVDPISSAYSPPQVIRFKPDPGEPAVDVTASPRQTAYLVTAQEQRNETRLRNRAILRGEEIIYSRRTFTQTYQDGAVVFTGGLTTVVSRPRQTNPVHRLSAQPQDPGPEGAGMGSLQRGETAEEGSPVRQAAIQATEKTQQDLAQVERELSTEQGRVENRKERAEAQLHQAAVDGDVLQMQSAARKLNELERREDAIQREERKVELEQIRLRREDGPGEVSSPAIGHHGPKAKIAGLLYSQDRVPNLSVGSQLDVLV